MCSRYALNASVGIYMYIQLQEKLVSGQDRNAHNNLNVAPCSVTLHLFCYLATVFSVLSNWIRRPARPHAIPVCLSTRLFNKSVKSHIFQQTEDYLLSNIRSFVHHFKVSKSRPNAGAVLVYLKMTVQRRLGRMSQLSSASGQRDTSRIAHQKKKKEI